MMVMVKHVPGNANKARAAVAPCAASSGSCGRALPSVCRTAGRAGTGQVLQATCSTAVACLPANLRGNCRTLFLFCLHHHLTDPHPSPFHTSCWVETERRARSAYADEIADLHLPDPHIYDGFVTRFSSLSADTPELIVHPLESAERVCPFISFERVAQLTSKPLGRRGPCSSALCRSSSLHWAELM